jgi:O-antigen/teichoic acid export membrane protein
MAIGLPEAISRGLGGSQGESAAGTFIIGALGLWWLAAVIVLGGTVLMTVGLGGSFVGSLPLATCALGALVALESILATFMRVRGHALVAELCVSFGSIIFTGVFLFVALTYPVSGVGALWLRCGVEICIATIVAFITIRPHWHLRSSWSIGSNVRDMIGPTLPLWLTSFSWFVLQNIGILLLALIASPAAVAYYQPMLKTADTAGGVASMFGPYLLPVAARLRAKGDIPQINSLYVQASRAAFALSMPILALLAFDSHFIAERLFGFTGHGTESIAVLLAIGYLLNAAVGFNGIVLESLASLRTLASRSVVVVTITTVVNIILIAYLGAIGAAVGTLTSYLAINALNSTLLYRAIRISPFQRRLLSPAFLTLLGVGIAVLLSMATVIPLSVAGPVMASALPLLLVFAPVVYRLITARRKRASLATNIATPDTKYNADSSAVGS